MVTCLKRQTVHIHNEMTQLVHWIHIYEFESHCVQMHFSTVVQAIVHASFGSIIVMEFIDATANRHLESEGVLHRNKGK